MAPVTRGQETEPSELFRTGMDIPVPLGNTRQTLLWGTVRIDLFAAVPPHRNREISLCPLIGHLSWLVVLVLVVVVAHCSSCAGNHLGVNPHVVSFSLPNVQLLGCHKTLQNRDESTAGICISRTFGSPESSILVYRICTPATSPVPPSL